MTMRTMMMMRMRMGQEWYLRMALLHMQAECITRCKLLEQYVSHENVKTQHTVRLMTWGSINMSPCKSDCPTVWLQIRVHVVPDWTHVHRSGQIKISHASLSEKDLLTHGTGSLTCPWLHTHPTQRGRISFLRASRPSINGFDSFGPVRHPDVFIGCRKGAAVNQSYS